MRGRACDWPPENWTNCTSRCVAAVFTVGRYDDWTRQPVQTLSIRWSTSCGVRPVHSSNEDGCFVSTGVFAATVPCWSGSRPRKSSSQGVASSGALCGSSDPNPRKHDLAAQEIAAQVMTAARMNEMSTSRTTARSSRPGRAHPPLLRIVGQRFSVPRCRLLELARQGIAALPRPQGAINQASSAHPVAFCRCSSSSWPLHLAFFLSPPHSLHSALVQPSASYPAPVVWTSFYPD
jgi:hypothetical protein